MKQYILVEYNWGSVSAYIVSAVSEHMAKKKLKRVDKSFQVDSVQEIVDGIQEVEL